MKKKSDAPVVIYTLRAAIARARAYDSVMVNHISVADSNQVDDEFILDEAPATFEEGGQSTVDKLKKVDLGTKEDPRLTFLSASLSAEEEVEYMPLLHEYCDIFAWNYTKMLVLDPRVAEHKLAVHPSVQPVKQMQRRFCPKLVPKIEKEVDKLIAANFIREVKYPSRTANIVPVKKKNGQIWVCIDFRDLNKACPKDDFPLPITELMADATTGHEALSFLDGSSGYNQIRMDPKNEEPTAFRTPKGIFCYKVMSFGLKNAGATYQRAMQNIFDDFLHKHVECYVDDLVVKTKELSDHLLDLRAVFERLRRFQLKMNPLKYAFGVTSGEFEVKKLELVPFWTHAGELLAQIPEASLHYVPRSKNGSADVLAGIAASLAQFDERPNEVPIYERWVVPPPIEEEVEEEQIEEMEVSFPISASQNEAGDWDATEMARTCRPCQLHAYYVHQPQEPLHPTIASWPFEVWGMDIIGPITPRSDSDRQYILAVTDYFSKWAEAAAYREVKATTVANFIRTQIIYRYGVPRYIVTDNGMSSKNRVMDRLCKKFRIQQWTSSAYNPTANGLAEAFNKTLCKILKKMICANKKSWDEKLGEALWAYKTSFRTLTQSTTYSLVYGTEAVLPLEVQLPSLRIAIREGLTTEECAQLRLAELESLDEQRLEAQQWLECYQSRMTRAFNKKVRLRSFQKGDLVLAVRRPMLFTSKTGGKFAPKWEGQYVVQEAYTNRAYKLVTSNGSELLITNGKFLK
ncbi:hypothetical protein H6P81_018230 [Aristolochia fimbriata]|uniref:Integrase catalytic domain-containing protein n=1 Tax=Aristolochia fimbriata TaxID=158543 RepID=A0AAV7E3D3_ARIFI|nr:hypothetical protein H6P81_018230 [Aristolochia fimbriata]